MSEEGALGGGRAGILVCFFSFIDVLLFGQCQFRLLA
jgi:hypothetical protein